MSAINESLRKLEERGALASTPLPAGVVPPGARVHQGAAEAQAASNRPMLYLMVFLTVVWVIWSEWDRRHPVAAPSVAQPRPVSPAVVVQPSERPVEPVPPQPLSAQLSGGAPMASPTAVQGAAPKPATRKEVTGGTPPQQGQPLPPAPPAPMPQVAPRPAQQNPAATALPLSPPVSSVSSGASPAAASANSGGTAPPRKPVAAMSTEPVNKVTTPRQRADVLYTQALRKLQEGRASDGRAALQELLAESPGHDDARQLLAALLLEDRQWARAENLLQDGLAHQPTAAALLMLARLKVERGEDVAALRLLREHLGRGQSDAEYRAFLAVLLVRQDRMPEAVEHYRFAVERQPGRGAWWAGLGLALAAQPAQSATAVQALERARALGGLAGPLADRVDARLAELQKAGAKP